MKMAVVYLGGPIDDTAGAALVESERKRFSDAIRGGRGGPVVVYDPSTAFPHAGSPVGQMDERQRKAISEINRSALERSDFAVFVGMAGGTRPFGTIREVEAASKLGVRVIIVDQTGSIGGHVEAWDVTVVGTPEEAASVVAGSSTGGDQAKFSTSDPHDELASIIAGYMLSRREHGMEYELLVDTRYVAAGRNVVATRGLVFGRLKDGVCRIGFGDGATAAVAGTEARDE